LKAKVAGENRKNRKNSEEIIVKTAFVRGLLTNLKGKTRRGRRNRRVRRGYVARDGGKKGKISRKKQRDSSVSSHPPSDKKKSQGKWFENP